MIIQIVLIAVVLVAAFFLVRATQDTKNVALRRLLLLVFVALAVASILFPQLTTEVAQWVGVGRGTDLLLYLLIIAFLSYAVVSYRRMVILENRLVDLARELAVARTHPATLTRAETFGPDSEPVMHGSEPDDSFPADPTAAPSDTPDAKEEQ